VGLFDIFKSAKKQDNFLIPYRAARALLNIMNGSCTTLEVLTEHVPELPKLKNTQKKKVLEILSIVYLVQVQKIMWKRIIKDKRDAKTFEKELFSQFEKELGIQPEPLVRDYIAYIQHIGSHGEIQYVGSKINGEVLNVESGFLMHAIGVLWGNTLKHFTAMVIDIQNHISEADVTPAQLPSLMASITPEIEAQKDVWKHTQEDKELEVK